MFLYSSLISLLPIDGWENIQDGFNVQALLFKDATFNEIPWLLCVCWLLKKNERKPGFDQAKFLSQRTPSSAIYSTLYQFPAYSQIHAHFQNLTIRH